jgi:ABC-type sugar transport system ATPase subunit
MRTHTRRVFQQLGVTVAAQDIVATLSIAQQQMVEIAKAILADARILVLDEPTAVLDENRVDVLFATIERLGAKGLGIVFISHHLEESFRIADKVAMLRDGRVTGSAKVGDVDQEWLVARMIGRSPWPTSRIRGRSGSRLLRSETCRCPERCRISPSR